MEAVTEVRNERGQLIYKSRSNYGTVSQEWYPGAFRAYPRAPRSGEGPPPSSAESLIDKYVQGRTTPSQPQ
jgi:hypothetical protein